MRFHIANDHVGAVGDALSRRFQHGIGLADAGRHAEEDLELSALLAGFVFLDGARRGSGQVVIGQRVL